MTVAVMATTTAADRERERIARSSPTRSPRCKCSGTGTVGRCACSVSPSSSRRPSPPRRAAAAPAPIAVTPAIVVKGASVSGARLVTRIDVAFAIPARTTAQRACVGRVRATTRLSARTRRTFSASLLHVGGRCRVALRGSLPKSFLGKTLTFRFAFAGNAVVKAFTTTKALKLAKPTVVPVPVPVTHRRRPPPPPSHRRCPHPPLGPTPCLT